MQIINDIQLSFDDVLIRPNKSFVNSRSEIALKRDYKFFQTGDVINGLFIMNSNMYTTGNEAVSNKLLEHGMFACLHKHFSVEQLFDIFKNMPFEHKNRCFYSIGLKNEETAKFEYLYKNFALKNVVIDVPNAYIPKFFKKIKEIREKYPDSRIIAGNVCTSEGCAEVIAAGADGVKINIGNGAMCLTRRQTGIGRPTLSTIIDCSNICHQLGALCISDGGIRYNSDIVKALAANADGVMIGSMFAGSDEATGEVIEKLYRTNEYGYAIYEASHNEMCGSVEEDGKLTPKGKLIQDFDCVETKEDYSAVLYKALQPKYKVKKFKQHFGMSSKLANDKFAGGMKNYKASEGREALIPYTGPLENTLIDMEGSLRSAMTYLGCTKLKHISKHTTFYRCNPESQLNRSLEQYDNG